ncbi:uracil-DNA glycosylase [uncultured Ilyobacter sp.]|uniref:uracil-DNA glycosylase n=1 Tax=uncultured Ilyobacter sp. TaxID=544433 RepID=UPI0029C85D3D|nr:uracil-DNA glycosylase [uncultured Ilyobacter sp.]
MKREFFLSENKIHPSYYEFFDGRTVEFIEEIFNTIGKDYTPRKEDIFKVFRYDLNNAKVLLLGMDPYPQKGIATGLSFEVPFDSWGDTRVNTSLKNMLKLLYKSYYGDILSMEELREKINKGDFRLLPPDKIFKKWANEGVIFLNTALTTKTGKAGAHINLWKFFTEKLLGFIGERNPALTYLLWGGKAQKFEKFIVSGKIIKHNHPAICGKLYNPQDFLNGSSFSETKKDINWIDEVEL